MKRWACLVVFAALILGGTCNASPDEVDETQKILVLLDMPAPHFRPDGNYAGAYVDAAAHAARRRVAGALARTHGLRLVTDWPLPVLGVDCYVMAVPLPQRPDEVAERVSREPRVAWAQPMAVFRPQGTHDDPLYSLQPAAREWHLAQLHSSADGRGVVIALIDSGVERDHPDLAGQVASAANFAVGGADAAEIHGTAVAGIMVARADNRMGIAGVAPQAKLLALRACWQAASAQTLCTSLSLALALQAAIDSSAPIINLSLGGPPDRLVQRLIEAAQQRGALVVSAVDRAQPRGGFPAQLPHVIAVDADDGAATPGVLLAPGLDVPTTVPGARWALVRGSSYAAAHVSGLLALVLQAQPGAGGGELVVRTDRHVDACGTLERASHRCLCDCQQAASIESVARP